MTTNSICSQAGKLRRAPVFLALAALAALPTAGSAADNNCAWTATTYPPYKIAIKDARGNATFGNGWDQVTLDPIGPLVCANSPFYQIAGDRFRSTKQGCDLINVTDRYDTLESVMNAARTALRQVGCPVAPAKPETALNGQTTKYTGAIVIRVSGREFRL